MQGPPEDESPVQAPKTIVLETWMQLIFRSLCKRLIDIVVRKEGRNSKGITQKGGEERCLFGELGGEGKSDKSRLIRYRYKDIIGT